MRRKKTLTSTEDLDPGLLQHIGSLGLETVAEYRDWCDENGFGRKLNKHSNQRCREKFHSQQTIAQARLARSKREKRNLVDVLTGICDRRLGEDDVTQPHLKRLCQSLRSNRGPKHERSTNRKTLQRLLVHLHQSRAKFFDGSPVIAELGDLPGNTFLEALALIAALPWLRCVEDWKPRSHSARRQFASLLRHLFVQYDDMPAFFDSVWFAGPTKEAAQRRNWFLHVGRGKNIRTCKLPIPFTKKMAHQFMRAPGNVTVEQALRWGQVHGLGGDERLAKAIFGTRLAMNFQDDDFWRTVIGWFVSHPLLDRAHVAPIIDYLHHQRFEPELVYVAAGHRDVTPPPQPHLSMKGRTPDSLLRKVNQWHRRLASDNTHQVRQWKPSGIEGFEFIEGSQTNGSLKCWTLRELLSSKALVAEGRKMKHCVATYASTCAQGHCSIWTMEVESNEGLLKAVTVEVRNNARLICQVRGKANRLPTEKERSVLRRWAAQTGLRTANYV